MHLAQTNIRGVWMGTMRLAVLAEGKAPQFIGISDLTMIPGKFRFPDTPAANDETFDDTSPQKLD